eukprot:m.102240 g.102240  ORF g.102240 m.102240 type:complete len:467 (+) comp27394_c2_seq2:79-1479(+)
MTVHYMPNDFWGILFRFKGTMLRKTVMWRVLGMTGYSLIATVLLLEFDGDSQTVANITNSSTPISPWVFDDDAKRAMGGQLHWMLFIITLLLGLRLNAAYMRWESAHLLMAELAETAGSIMEMVTEAIGCDTSTQIETRCVRIEKVRRLTIATVVSILKVSPQEIVEDTTDLTHPECHLLSKQQYDDTHGVITHEPRSTQQYEFSADVRPTMVVAFLRQELVACWRRGVLHIKTLTTLSKKVDRFSAQIYTLPQMPFVFTQFLKSIIVVWLLAQPFFVFDEFGILTPVFSLAMSMLFFGAEAIGVVIEEPYATHMNSMDIESVLNSIDRHLATIVSQKYSELGFEEFHIPRYNAHLFWDSHRKLSSAKLERMFVSPSSHVPFRSSTRHRRQPQHQRQSSPWVTRQGNTNADNVYLHEAGSLAYFELSLSRKEDIIDANKQDRKRDSTEFSPLLDKSLPPFMHKSFV